MPGLVTLDEMKAKQEDVIKKRQSQLAKKDAEARLIEKERQRKKKKEQQKVGSQRKITIRVNCAGE